MEGIQGLVKSKQVPHAKDFSVSEDIGHVFIAPEKEIRTHIWELLEGRVQFQGRKGFL